MLLLLFAALFVVVFFGLLYFIYLFVISFPFLFFFFQLFFSVWPPRRVSMRWRVSALCASIANRKSWGWKRTATLSGESSTALPNCCTASGHSPCNGTFCAASLSCTAQLLLSSFPSAKARARKSCCHWRALDGALCLTKLISGELFNDHPMSRGTCAGNPWLKKERANLRSCEYWES